MKGYYKFYTKNGKKAFIKLCKNINNSKVIIKFMRPKDDNWLYHYPDKKFENCLDVIYYILKNLETNKTRFKVC